MRYLVEFDNAKTLQVEADRVEVKAAEKMVYFIEDVTERVAAAVSIYNMLFFRPE